MAAVKRSNWGADVGAEPLVGERGLGALRALLPEPRLEGKGWGYPPRASLLPLCRKKLASPRGLRSRLADWSDLSHAKLF